MGTRSNRGAHSISADDIDSKLTSHLLGYTMTYSKGLKLRPEATDTAANIEVKQLVDLDIGDAVHEHQLSSEQRSSILRTFMFMKDKFDSNGNFTKYKGRLVADGSVQSRQQLSEVYGSISSPIAALTSIMISLGIATSRGMYIETGDVDGAFLRGTLDDDTYIRLPPPMATKWISYRSSDSEFLNPKGELILKLKKSLYGCSQSPLVWHRNVDDYMKSIGFNSLPKDPCIYKKMDGDVLSIVIFYVDDYMIISDKEEIGKKYGDMIEEHYGQVTRKFGCTHDYIGICIERGGDLTELSMFGYIDKILQALPATKHCSTPAGSNLFEIKGGPLLTGDKAKVFYSVVYMLLYLAQRCRPDILLPTSFLTTRVTKATQDDFDKLQRVSNYLEPTKRLKMHIKGGETIDLICYVDASHAVHDDFKSHTGSIISINNRCIVNVKSTKQGLSTKSSTESELVAVSDALPQIIYVKEFVQELLGSQVPTTFMQDNTSTISLIKAGRPLSQSTRHINIRFFFVHQYHSDGSIDVVHCKTENMYSDGFTKPLQGVAFTKFKNYVLGIEYPDV